MEFPKPMNPSAQAIRPLLLKPHGGELDFSEMWRYRNLLYFLCWRDVKVRYKQTVLGASWALIQPLFTTIVFTFIFGKIAQIPSDGIPYPLFSLAALIPWTYFSGALTRSTTSVVNNAHLISKIYFPRLLIPLSATLPGILDFSISLVVLFGFMFYMGRPPSPMVLVSVPLCFLWMFVLVFGTSLWLGTFHVKFRDVGHALPFFTQLWMYVSPVIFPTSYIPEKYRWLALLNPLTGIIETFRATLFSTPIPRQAIAISLWQTIFVTLTGIYFFQRRSQTFADIV